MATKIKIPEGFEDVTTFMRLKPYLATSRPELLGVQVIRGFGAAAPFGFDAAVAVATDGHTLLAARVDADPAVCPIAEEYTPPRVEQTVAYWTPKYTATLDVRTLKSAVKGVKDSWARSEQREADVADLAEVEAELDLLQARRTAVLLRIDGAAAEARATHDRNVEKAKAKAKGVRKAHAKAQERNGGYVSPAVLLRPGNVSALELVFARDMWPVSEEKHPHLSIHYLERVVKTFANETSITIGIEDSYSPVLFRGQNALALVMPMRP